MRKYLSDTETHHSVQCPPPLQTGVGILCLETTLDVNRDVTFPTFPESAAVPVALQPRPTWRGGAPRRVSDSVQTSFKSVLEFLNLAGRCGARGWMLLVTRVGDHLETFCLPQAEVPAGELERGKVIDPWNPKQGRAT